MLNDLPDDLLYIIIKKMDNRKDIIDRRPYPSEFPIIFLKSLRDTSKKFRNIINGYRDFWESEEEDEKDKNPVWGFSNPKCIYNTNKIYISKTTNTQMENILKHNISKSTFIWLLNNNINLSLQNINTIIRYNRIDLLKVGFFYSSFLKILFNRFYVDITAHNNLLSFSSEPLNPIIVAGEYQRIEIIDILLKSSTIGNPYIKEINNLFILSIKKGFKNLLSYLITNYIDDIKEVIPKKIGQIMSRIENIEDILFYLLVNDIIDPNEDIIKYSILKNYNQLFFYLINDQKVIKDLIDYSIEANNYVVFNYLINNSDTKLTSKRISKVFKRRKYIKKDFIENIIQNHINILIDIDDLILIALEINISDELIIKLIDHDFLINHVCLEKCLNVKRYHLLEKLMIKFNRVVCP